MKQPRYHPWRPKHPAQVLYTKAFRTDFSRIPDAGPLESYSIPSYRRYLCIPTSEEDDPSRAEAIRAILKGRQLEKEGD